MNALIGYTFVTFAAGGMADWMPTFLKREVGIDYGTAGLVVGGASVVGGLGGTIIGGHLGDKLKGKIRQSYLAVSWIPLVPATLLGVIIIYVLRQ